MFFFGLLFGLELVEGGVLFWGEEGVGGFDEVVCVEYVICWFFGISVLGEMSGELVEFC